MLSSKVLDLQKKQNSKILNIKKFYDAPPPPDPEKITNHRTYFKIISCCKDNKKS